MALTPKSNRLAGLVLAVALMLTTVPIFAQDVTDDSDEFRGLVTVEGLPPEAPHEGAVITVDLSKNRVYLFRDGQLVRQSPVATGSDKVLRGKGHVWWFRTPRGLHQVLRRIENPIWTKPDWAYVEEGKAIPAANSPDRKVKGKMGKYALDLGGGVMLHGTDDPKTIGQRVSHGCIRIPADMLKQLWDVAQVGTPVYIFESAPDPQVLARKGLNDLDMLAVD
ncbi:MAG TPA: L,D-transpeptidase [Thermoanaerobaculia bacterium]|nr:L,D-transpeptidase [Thermoanaerobaculia bacterium]